MTKARSDIQGHPEAPDPARAYAIEAIAAQAKRFPDLEFRGDADFAAGRDGAFAHAIFDSVLRRWLTLEFVIARGLKQPFSAIEPDLRAVLLGGAAQLLFLDRVPDHAAIDESVRHAKSRIRTGAGGLVNAALRRVAELKGESGARPDDWMQRRDLLLTPDGKAMKMRAEVLPREFAHRLAIQTSHPEGLLRRWIAAHGEENASLFAMKGIAAVPTILNIEADESEGALLVDRGLAMRHEDPLALVWTGDRTSLREVLARNRLWVQDPSSAEVVRTASVVEGADRVHRIVDLCAGQGTKTRQLLQRFRNASVLAADVDDRRLETLKHVFQSEQRVEVTHARAVREGNGKADLALLDVPCSNSGVLGRRVEARYRIRGKSVAELVEIQRAILQQGAAIVRDRGFVVYSTCSLEPEENSEHLKWARHELGLEVLAERSNVPRGGCGLDQGVARDGSYVAVLRKGGGR
ncbi:MAG: hypothetical protein KF691_10205 [Phycisphaeraceae bacterium]|nr:hypothetical protein [Phycisphaeraceae bacterium]